MSANFLKIAFVFLICSILAQEKSEDAVAVNASNDQIEKEFEEWREEYQ